MPRPSPHTRPRRRSRSRLWPIVLALVACFTAGLSGAAAQTRPATVPLGPPDKSMMHPIIFYLAHGEANACGPGCSEWIIADGKIDAGAAYRLERLLDQLNGARPPLFLHSPGGLVNVAMELGRLVRAHGLTVSVGHTIPLNCGSGPAHQTSCAAIIGAGQRLEARLDALTAMCNSACVYVLAGGSVRLIPPWVALGVHDVGFEPSTGLFRPTRLAMMIGKELADERLHAYMREMGIDTRLLTESFAVPFTSMGRLSREDAACFGLDRRELGETPWQFFDKPQPAVRKSFFVRTGDKQARYVNGMVSVFCARGYDGHRILSFGREHLDSDTDDFTTQPPVSATVNGQDIALTRVPNIKLYVRQGRLPMTAVEGAADKATLVLPGAELGRQQGPSGDVKLSMFGFTQAQAKLQNACVQATYNAMIAGPQTASVEALAALSSHSPQPALRANVTPVPSAKPLGPGATRAEVDATLGAPTKTVGTVSLYSYVSSSQERKVMAGYFDASKHLVRFARYAAKDGKIIDEITQAELSSGAELTIIRGLLAKPGDTSADSGASSPQLHSPQ